ncbi:hypothetical protein BFW01_g7821 [Lasiodiplodia theobromae]|uniref:Uncharacterized protein n=1 Tax=Lasiodiplodia theobromae TaxID=45133 RepID=A0A5N5DGC2_9PEZI|nr:uncharacterized protein LTHEOB_3378 [Lasiodiplodia theobromae]KAB2576805.1 hypothetical protein DBV05_g4619 [Lasiodiplodia theobromae]KAF4534570.1 hypothetical protein LTHEOB_3378 [Lasiodiplodia theobromae]KAF9636925.1 hypothetical protein BFW01_g7821 [Lasiodiplodia theobromae]
MADQASNDTPLEGTPAADVEMGGSGEYAEDNTATNNPDQQAGNEGDDNDEGVEMAEIEPETPKVVKFLDYLKSPIIELVVGRGDNQTLLTVHQALLTKSPFFEEQCARFTDGDTHRRIELADEDLDAMGSLLEYLYHNEYFPKRLSADRDSKLEPDPTVSGPDVEGVQLLKHARIYTLAEKFGLPDLQSLAHSKIHRTESTPKGEIVYARYVYANTSPEDRTIRRPVAAFWAHRSHVLRHHAENEFRAMCLDFPQFGFDVLSMVLDAKEKRSGGGSSGEPVVGVSASSASAEPPRSARKRARVSYG